jgi:hypothetical protein
LVHGVLRCEVYSQIVNITFRGGYELTSVYAQKQRKLTPKKNIECIVFAEFYLLTMKKYLNYRFN